MTYKIPGQTKNQNLRWSTFGALVVMLATSTFCPTAAIAQSGAGSIKGTIQDATGSSIPGCLVHVVNQSTGVAYDTTANATGFYSVPGLFAGNYTLTFTAPGMKKYQASVGLQNAQNVVLSPTLTVGEVAEQVTVIGNEIQLVTTDSGTISNQLDRTRIDQLPQNGRNVLGLAAATTPGLEAGGQRANGLMPEGLEYTQDGAQVGNPIQILNPNSVVRLPNGHSLVTCYAQRKIYEYNGNQQVWDHQTDGVVFVARRR